MFLTAAETNNLDEASLTAFIERKLPEGRHLDYKAALSGNGWDNQAREFLKDVTAFANAGGGHLLIGVKEPDEKLSASEQMIGLDDGFNVASKLENLSTSSIDPRISGLLIRPIEFNGKNSIIVVRVPPSLSRPHMAVHGKHSDTGLPSDTARSRVGRAGRRHCKYCL
jgi:predicted HTH transcriptional regulator